MSKLFTHTITGLVVLMSGLTSCSQEKKTKDVYRPNPPVVDDGQHRTGLNEWSVQTVKRLDLQDVLDLTDSAPVQVKTHTDCRMNGTNFYAQSDFVGELHILVWQMLPEALLTIPLGSLQCDFVFDLFNARGSNHIFTVSSIPLVEQRPANVRLSRELDETPEGILDLVAGQTANVHVRFDNSAPAKAALTCGDFEVNALPFETVAEFSHFDFNVPKILDGRPADILKAKPLQTCRIVILQGEKKVGLSRLFHLQLPRPPVEVQPEQIPLQALIDQTGPLKVYPLSDFLTDTFRRRKPFIVAAWRVSNHESFTRTLRIPQRPLALGLTAIMTPMPGGRINKMTYALPVLSLVMPGQPTVIRQDGQFMEVELPGQSDLEILARMDPPGQWNCRTTLLTPWGVDLRAAEAIAIGDVLATGEVISSSALEFTPLQLAPGPVVSLDAMTNVSPCPWN